MLSLEIGKELSTCCVVSSCFKVNCLNLWRSIRAYTLHQYLSLFVIENSKNYFSKVTTRSKRVYTLVDLPC
jgi:hypothetical protein